MSEKMERLFFSGLESVSWLSKTEIREREEEKNNNDVCN